MPLANLLTSATDMGLMVAVSQVRSPAQVKLMTIRLSSEIMNSVSRVIGVSVSVLSKRVITLLTL